MALTKHFVKLQAGSGPRALRAEYDFYETPAWAVEQLLAREKFEGSVWEPASGAGAIARFFPGCKAGDLRTDDRVHGEKGKDFLASNDRADHIVTNPPFRLAREFVIHALEQADKKVAMFLKLQFLEGTSNREEIFSTRPPKRVWVFSDRVGCVKNGVMFTGLMSFAWFVWEKGWYGAPELGWIWKERA